MAILEEASAWLHARGIDQWPRTFTPAALEQSIARTETWLALVDGTISGTATLTWSDPLWDDLGGQAGYVHRLATRRTTPGLGATVLAWAADVTRRFGRRSLRLDCVATNTALCAYYEQAGFERRGDKLSGDTVVSRFELDLS